MPHYWSPGQSKPDHRALMPAKSSQASGAVKMLAKTDHRQLAGVGPSWKGSTDGMRLALGGSSMRPPGHRTWCGSAKDRRRSFQ